MKLFPVLSILLLAMPLSISAEETASTQPLRVLGFNIQHGQGMDNKIDLQRVADAILAQKPDIVTLQEVDNGCRRSGKVDQAAELSKLTGMHHVFRKAMDYDGGEYGQAILARAPLTDVKVHKLPGDGEPRIVISAITQTHLGPVTAATIHLAYRNKEDQLDQATATSQALKEAKTPVVLVGDFNADPDSETIAVFQKEPWSVVEKSSPSLTFPADKPNVEIDYAITIGLTPEGPTTVIDDAITSDHRPILTLFSKPK